MSLTAGARQGVSHGIIPEAQAESRALRAPSGRKQACFQPADAVGSMAISGLAGAADVRAVRQSAIRMNRRAALGTALLLPLPTTIRASAAEPEPAVSLTDEEMAARIARKQELLKRQSLKGKADAKGRGTELR